MTAQPFAGCFGPTTKPLTPPGAFESLISSQSLDIMANTKSAIKAARKSKRLHDRNQSVKTRLKTLHKNFEAAAAANDAANAKQAGVAYISAMDKAKKSGVVHRNAAARAKSRVAKFVLAK
jgi:small subunit ribosomal protein S20